MKSYFAGAICAALILAACTPAEQKTDAAAPAGPSLEGVWKRAETVIAEGEKNAGTHTADVQPSLYIFTKSHYSINAVNGYEARPELKETPTDAETLAAFTAFTGNAGTYKLEGGALTTTPVVAKNPNFMKGTPNANPTLVEWAGEDVWLTSTQTSGAKNRTRLVKVAD